MDAHSFDRLVADSSRRPSRRNALRLLAGGFCGALLTRTRVANALAQRPDRDGDGLFDDDETDVYGTDPDNPDTDGDGDSDGLEVYNGTDPRTPHGGAPPPPDNGGCAPGECIDDIVDPGNITPDMLQVPCAAGLTDCGDYCANITQDAANCGICGWDCGSRDLYFCYLGMCVGWCPEGSRRCTGEYICRNYPEPCPG